MPYLISQLSWLSILLGLLFRLLLELLLDLLLHFFLDEFLCPSDPPVRSPD